MPRTPYSLLLLTLTLLYSYHYKLLYASAASSKPQPFERHIVAVGDLHGDYDSFLQVLRFSGVVDDKDNWSGKVDVFVQTGDISDRGLHMAAICKKMDDLREQAKSKNGVVISLMGSHEWMNTAGNWQDVSPDELDQNNKTFASSKDRFETITTGYIGKSWKENYVTASRVPLHPFLGPPNTPYPSNSAADASKLSHSALAFAHGGLSPTYRRLTPFPTTINQHASSLLEKMQTRSPLPVPYPEAPHRPRPVKDMTNGEREIMSIEGPVLYRGWAAKNDDSESEYQFCQDLEGVLQKTGTRRMIIGHARSKRIQSRCNHKLISIDTGISDTYRSDGGMPSALSIRYSLTPGRFIKENPNEQSWLEEEVISALYADSSKNKKKTYDNFVVGDFKIVE